MTKLDKFFATLVLITIAALNVQAATPTTPTSAASTNSSSTANSTTVQPGPFVPATPDVDARGYILIDANSGQILAEKNPDQRMEPASLTKMMTMYVISQSLKSGRIHLTDLVTVSKEAWKTGGSRMFIVVGKKVSVQDLINGIVIASGNDAAVAMAEYIGGTEENFVAMMNQAAAQLGMKNSHWADVNGLPTSDHYTTPRDLAILAQALINDFPDYYKAWYSQKWLDYNHIKQANRNRLLWRDPSVDGIKTGFTNGAGYCLVASADRNGMRLISVIMGSSSTTARTNSTEALINWAFRYYSTHQLYAGGRPLAVPRVWFGSNKDVPLGLAQNLYVTIPTGQYQNLKAFLIVQPVLRAPIVKGQSYGEVDVTLSDRALLTQPVIALRNNPQGNIIERARDKLILFFQHA